MHVERDKIVPDADVAITGDAGIGARDEVVDATNKCVDATDKGVDATISTLC